jgi:hypothetical protein
MEPSPAPAVLADEFSRTHLVHFLPNASLVRARAPMAHRTRGLDHVKDGEEDMPEALGIPEKRTGHFSRLRGSNAACAV